MPCDCTFTAHLGRPASIAKEAGKLHDFLMNPKSRPDLQTPEAQAFLRHLETHYHNDKTDALMPWLTREWKRGHLQFPQRDEAMRSDIEDAGGTWNPTVQSRPNLMMDNYVWPRGRFDTQLSPATLNHWGDFLGANHPVRRGLGDLMQHDINSFQLKIGDWNNAMADAAEAKALQGGEVVHTTPDNWTVRKLTTPEELTAEGDAMGHCVGGYCDDVQSGRSLIYSLRDPEGHPHVTTEISPGHTTAGVSNPNWLDEYFSDPHSSLIQRGLQNTPGIQEGLHAYQRQALEMQEGMRQKYDPEVVQWQGLYNELAAERSRGHRRDEFPIQAHPENGTVVQIQGKGNHEPIDEYKARLADWFRTYPPEQRPTRNNDEDPSLFDDDGYHHYRLDHPDLIPLHEREFGSLTPQPGGVEDEYGLIRQKGGMLPSDYDDLLTHIGVNDYGPWATHNSQHVDDIYRLAKERGEIPQLSKALEGYQDEQQSNFDDWMDQNYQYAPRYPEEPTGWENEEGDDVGEGEGRPYWQVRPDQDDPYNDKYYSEAEAEKAYDTERTEWERQHPGVSAVSQLYGLMNPHFGAHPETGEQGYWNDLPQQPPPQQPQPPTTAKVAMPIIPTKWDALRQPRADYAGEFPQFPDREQFAMRSPEYLAWIDANRPAMEAHRDREKEWDRAARNAMATGRMTPAQVTDLGYHPVSHEMGSDYGYSRPKWGAWRPLPPQLYHVTTNLPGIAATGKLLAPDELDLEGRGRGLGGGSQDTISLSDSLDEARNMERAMREGADVASGRLPIERMVEMARTGEGAEKPWLKAIFGNYDWSNGNPRALDDLLLGRKPFYRHLLPEDHPLREPSSGLGGARTAEEWAQHGYHPYPDVNPSLLGQPDKPMYLEQSVYRNLNPEEKAHEAFEWWRNPYASMRSWAGGPSDPMFTSVDSHWFANLDPSHIGIVQAAPVPGGHGYPMSSLGEWRVPTGDAVNITHINGQPYMPRTAHTIVAAPLYKRWVFSPASGQVTLGDNTSAEPQYHTDLAREINEPNLIHGYAYRIGNGWRLTDWDSQPLDDTYVVAQVMRALAGDQAPSGPQDGSWSPQDQDWARVHHGLPS